MGAGRVILLNGTASSGKSTVARALQAQAEEPWLRTGMDSLWNMVPARWTDQGSQASEGLARRPRPAPGGGETIEVIVGPAGQQWTRAMHRSVRAMADAGVDILVEDVLLERGWLLDWAEVLDGLRAWMVGIRCPAPVLRQRERARGSRAPAGGVDQLPVVHAHGDYDLEIDTSLASPEHCAGRISDHVAAHAPRALAGFLRRARA